VARIFNTYGPRMHPNDGRVVSNFIIQALLGRNITGYGDGLQARSFCFVDDVIEGLVKLMISSDDVTGPINIGRSDEFTILELETTIIDFVGSRSCIVHRPLPQDDPRQRKPNISKAQELLSRAPHIGLEDGLKRTIIYFEKLLAEERLGELLAK
jgi:UDP-glucuronate decarboxylase